jgi:EAL domain-containing protein (putative c-di-GMP-specific phosphodiesterase class I)
MAQRSTREPHGVFSASIPPRATQRTGAGTSFSRISSALCPTRSARLVVQPKVDLADFACLGGEALLRWRHPTLGEILPGEFIPLIEHSPLVREMTEFVVDRACLAAAHWLRTGLNLELSINVSAANFEEEDLAERIQRALLRHSIPPRSLMIEITESTAMANVGSTLRHLEALDETGFPIAIDDFGTGYSSLAYLQKLPARTIKIDQAFIRSVDTDPRGAELVRSMIGFFRELDYRVIAEGVESRATALLLRELGCHEAQGYWFSRPMEFEAFAGWIAAHQLANEALAA